MPPQPPEPSAEMRVRLPDGREVPISEALAAIAGDSGSEESPTSPPTPLGGFSVPLTPKTPEPPTTGTREDFLSAMGTLGAEALPLAAGLATGGMSLPVSLLATGGAGIASEFLQGGDARRAGMRGLLEALLEGVGRGAVPAAKFLGRNAVRLSSGADEARRFASRTGGPPTGEVDQLVSQMLDSGTPITKGGVRRAGDQAHEASVDLARQLVEAPPIAVGDEILPAVSRAGSEQVAGSPLPGRTSDTVNSVLSDTLFGAPPGPRLAGNAPSAPVDLLGPMVPAERGARIAQTAIPQGIGTTSEMERAIIEAFQDAIESRTTGSPLARIRNNQALQETLDRLLPSAGVLAGSGQMTSRGALAGMGTAPFLGTVSNPVAAALAATLFTGLAPSNLSRGAVGLNRIAPALGMVPTAVRGAHVFGETQELARRRLEGTP